eukprot:6384229-Amphidinium_carterae.1
MMIEAWYLRCQRTALHEIGIDQIIDNIIQKWLLPRLQTWWSSAGPHSYVAAELNLTKASCLDRVRS